MTQGDPLPRSRSSQWTARDVLLVVAALALLAGVTAVVARREEWASLVGANASIPVSIATLTTSDFHSLALDPRDPDIVYFGHHQGVLKSTDGGKTWKSVNALSMKMALGLAQDPRDPRIVYAGTEGGLYRSNADRTAWTRVGFAGKDIAIVAISRANPARILVVDAQGRVYRSDNSGATWNGN